MEMVELQHQMMGYDRSATMFSPDGLILQVEYAEKTVRLGSASIGIKCADGVVIVADKGKKDPLINLSSVDKIYEIDDHVIASAAGILSDARILINHVRIIAQQHKTIYDSAIDVESIIREIADIKQHYTQSTGVRPFGVAFIVAGKDVNTFKLYATEITGNYFEYNATAIGQNDEKIKELLRKQWKKDIKIEEAIKLALNIFKKILGDKFEIDRFTAAYIKEGSDKYEKLEPDKLKKYLK